ncbi:hypothetical protein JYU34_005619 [Plutella xylostella]|uniref:Uncharacterized protein n=1 Tax=Plutella xylostella TaxID=51655 RepID=A0ABQ7QTP7_PLUXY|nr:hypothetical protein JYU34_005619 [Plutella xylostella]
MEGFSKALASTFYPLTPSEGLREYQKYQIVGNEHLHSTLQYLETENMADEKVLLKEVVVLASVKQEVWVSRRTLAVGILILTMVLVASPVLILLLRHTVTTIQVGV